MGHHFPEGVVGILTVDFAPVIRSEYATLSGEGDVVCAIGIYESSEGIQFDAFIASEYDREIILWIRLVDMRPPRLIHTVLVRLGKTGRENEGISKGAATGSIS